MIEYGAKQGKPQPLQVDVAAQDAMGCSPLHVAAYVGHTDSCRVLLRYGANSLQLDNGGACQTVTPGMLDDKNNNNGSPCLNILCAKRLEVEVHIKRVQSTTGIACHRFVSLRA